jgi:hypothetical protein
MFAWDNEDIKAQQAAERATASDHAAALPRVRAGPAGCCIARSFSAYWAWSGTGQFHVDCSLVQLRVARECASKPQPPGHLRLRVAFLQNSMQHAPARGGSRPI